ncbi:MAG: protein kinase [Spongiibacteraceae bacterium]|nr:protein kinase [Spongiibacteraceae bacterium]
MNATLPLSELDYLAGATRRQLRVSYGGSSSAGIKSLNEDAFAARLPVGSEALLKGAVACIADGVSGSDNAQLASQTSVTHFMADYYSTPDSWPVKTAASRVLSALNAWLFHHGRQSLRPSDGLVTTFSAVVLKSTTAHIFHVGDSRVWLWRQRDLEQLTRDHQHVQRNDRPFLTRALGMDSRLEVDYTVEELEVGDWLMLTTDGVHDVLSRKTLAALLAASPSEAANGTAATETELPALEGVAQRIVAAALAAGSTDNASCLLLRVDELPVENLDELHQRLANLSVPPPLDRGMRIDGLRVERVLHSGSRSVVYEVVDERAGEPPLSDVTRRMVLKAPSALFDDDPVYLEAFAREQWIGRRIDHPCVMRCLPRPSGSHYLYNLCERVEGESLRQWMHDHPSPSLTTVRAILDDICAGLRAFQRLQMRHGDLKPDNVMITPEGRARLIDFGAVTVAGLEEIRSSLREVPPGGALDYLAPETLTGEISGISAEIYSLGVLAYEMLTGELPFEKPLLDRGPAAHRERRYRPLQERRPDLPLWVDLALRKALAPLPAQRHAALSELQHDLNVPNSALLERHEQRPLAQRDPVRTWQAVALLLLLAVIAQALLLGS